MAEGRSYSHRTKEGGIKASGRKEMGRGPVLTEHVLGARPDTVPEAGDVA